jgi:putative superfamily III holin-X
MSEPYPPSPETERSEPPQNIATAITEVSERATLLIREEIELAKAEVAEKATKLIKGAVVGVAAGVFFVMALVFALVGCAWLLYYYLPGNDFTYFWGFFAMAVILVLLGALAGLIAAKAVKRGSPPVPNMAIEEARKIREAVSSAPEQHGAGTAQPATGAGGES